MRSIPWLLVCVLALAGCTSWVKPGVSQEARNVDLKDCETKGYGDVFVYNFDVHAPGYSTPGSEVCEIQNGHRRSCSYSQGGLTLPSDGTVDANEKARKVFVEHCMYQRGYHKK